MNITQKTILIAVQACLILIFTGCTMSLGPIGVTLKNSMPPVEVTLPAITLDDTPGGKEVAKRFMDPDQQNESAVESAIELSKRHADLTDELLLLREQNSTLKAENRKLSDKLTLFETQVQRSQRELKEANELMIDMRIELNNWKTDILGFRGEIRDAEKAQLQALLKILNILGGEAPSQTINNAVSKNDAQK